MNTATDCRLPTSFFAALLEHMSVAFPVLLCPGRGWVVEWGKKGPTYRIAFFISVVLL